MPIEIRCQKCGQKLRAPDKLAGKQVKCPKCAAAIRVEAPAEAATGPKAEKSKSDSPPDQWYMQTDDGESYGPIPKSELDEWVKEGRIDSTCQVLREGWEQWKWAEEVYPEVAESAETGEVAPQAQADPFAPPRAAYLLMACFSRPCPSK